MTRHVHEITALYRAYEPHSVMIAAEAVQALAKQEMVAAVEAVTAVVVVESQAMVVAVLADRVGQVMATQVVD